MRWFNLAMPLVYIAIGVLLLFTASINGIIERVRVPLAWVLIGYGAYRAWRVYRKTIADRNA